MEIGPEMKKCIVPEAFLLFSLPWNTSSGGSGGIRGISLDTAGANSPFDGDVQASLLDFLVSDHIIYWTNVHDMVTSLFNNYDASNF